MSKKSSGPEFKVQSEIAAYAGLAYPWALITCSVAGTFVNLGMVMKMAKLGYRKGTPDLLVFEPRGGYFGLLLEVKAKDGSLSPEQVEFLNRAALRGYKTAVCWSREEGIAVLDAYLKMPPTRPVDARSPEPSTDSGDLFS